MFAPPHIAAAPAEQDSLDHEFFGTDEQGKFGAVVEQPNKLMEVNHVERAVFNAQNSREIGQAPHHFGPDYMARIAGLVVQENRKRKLRNQALEVAGEFRLARAKVIGRRKDECPRACVRRGASDLDGPRLRAVGYPDEDRNAAIHEPTGVRNELAPKPVTQCRSFTCGPEDEQSINTARQDVLDQAFEAGEIQSVGSSQRRDHRRNDSAQRFREHVAHG